MSNTKILKLRYKLIARLAKLLTIIHKTVNVTLDNVFIGGKDLYTSDEWYAITKDPYYLSCPLKNSHYVTFLEHFKDFSEVSDSEIENTDYFKKISDCIRLTGHYFEATNKDEIILFARKFLAFFNACETGKTVENPEHGIGHSTAAPPILFKVFSSDKYEIFDGHHRLAIDYVLKKSFSTSVIIGSKKTYLQKLVIDVAQTEGRFELYQPIPFQEFKEWHLIRSCTDRFNMMYDFLNKTDFCGTDKTIIDLACSYGWFVNEFSKKGFLTSGVERDAKALEIGKLSYGLDDSTIINEDIDPFITACTNKYDVVIFLSIIHHYWLGRCTLSAEEVLRALDKITGKILFLDSGQSHERWFRKNLSLWSDDFIIDLIKKHTTFKDVIKLGKDTDNRGIYSDNYKRTLFACIR